MKMLGSKETLQKKYVKLKLIMNIFIYRNLSNTFKNFHTLSLMS